MGATRTSSTPSAPFLVVLKMQGVWNWPQSFSLGVFHLFSSCYLPSSAIFMTEAREGLVAFAVTVHVSGTQELQEAGDVLAWCIRCSHHLPSFRSTLYFYFFISYHLFLGKDSTWQL